MRPKVINRQNILTVIGAIHDVLKDWGVDELAMATRSKSHPLSTYGRRDGHGSKSTTNFASQNIQFKLLHPCPTPP